MFLKLAWRNIWRNPRRSWLMMGSLVLTILLSLLMQAQQEGTYRAILKYAVKNHSGHLQIYPPTADSKQNAPLLLGHLSVLDSLSQTDFREDILIPRLVRQAEAHSSHQTQNIYLWGIDPKKEELLGKPSQYLVKGHYFNQVNQKSVLIGQGLAHHLTLTVGDSLHLQSQNQAGELVKQSFYIQGIVKLPLSNLDKKMVYMPLQTAQSFWEAPKNVSYYALLLKNPSSISYKKAILKNALPPSLATIKTWKETQPELSQVIQSQQWGAGLMLSVLYVVIGLGLWMSMVLLTHERRDELEVLVSIGMTRLELGFSLALEMLLLGLLGLLMGSLMAIPLLFYLMQNPILLSGSIADAVSDLGLRPSLDYYFEFSSLIVPNLRLLGGLLFMSLYPVYQLFHFRTKNTSLRMWSFNSLGLIPSLAWKNLLRNPTRSLLIVSSIGIGLGIGTFIWAFANGLQTQRLQYQLNHSLGHLKITHKDFDEEKPLQAFLNFEGDLKEKIENLGKEITAFSPRLNVYGMASNSKKSLGVDIYGVISADEKKVFLMYQNMIEGTYFENSSIKHPILIGQKLAQNLNLKLGEELLLTLPQLKKGSRKDTFNITGIYAMQNANFEKTHVFIQANDFQKCTGLETNQYHQITFKTPDYHQALPFSKKIQMQLPSYQVKSWAEIAPEFAYLEEVLEQFFTIFTGIILLALSFALMNMMLMSVLERQQEWAMLISVGMQKKQIFLLVILETIFLAVFGLGVGLGLAWISIAWSHSVGIDLAWFDTQFTKMGINTKIYPFLTYKEYLTVGVLLIITALLSALYPAWLALKTNTVKALHKN